MSTKLETLEWSWWFSYGKDNFLQLDEDTVTQILGVNGNGKSSIYLIIEELMYNKNSKGIKKSDIPNRNGPGGYWGRLTFTKDEDQYAIEVDRKTTIKCKLSKNGQDISSHTATETFKTLERLFGNDFKTNSQLINQTPTSSLQFLTATDTNRKKFFIDLLQMDEYVRLFDTFKEAAKQHANTVLTIETKVATVEQWLRDNKLESTDPIEPKPVDIDLFDDERRAAGLTSSIQNINANNRNIAKNNQYREMLEAINIKEISAIECEEYQSYDEHQGLLGGLQSELHQHTKQINKLASLGDSCPTCEQSIEPEFKTNLIHVEEEAISSVEEKIQIIQLEIERIKENNKVHKYKQKQTKSWEELFRSVDSSLPKIPINKADLEDELSELTIKISNARHALKKLTEYNENAARHNSRIQVILEQGDQFEKQLKELSVQLVEEQENLNDLELLKKAFSTTGLIAYKIENQVKDLEDLTNEYLGELSDGRFTIEFSVVSDKLNVIVTDNGTIVDILSLSSGELARVATSTLLALRKLMNGISKSEINILFLDEVTNVLDEQGREKLVEVLLKEDLNTYIVSHGWSHPLLTMLNVVKEDGVSRIEHA